MCSRTLSPIYAVHSLHVGQPFEVEYVPNQALGVAHFLHARVHQLLVKALEPPSLTYLGLDEVLVNRRQLDREQGVQQLNHAFLGLHLCAPSVPTCGSLVS
jgi:hypothetical protein